jgi:uncharacterized protein (TIGR02266 family)
VVDERRRDVRVRRGGVVRCESASGAGFVSRWVDLGTGGLFVETATPTPAGVLLTLEIEIPGESAPCAAVGRVTWVREGDGAGGKPAGMGVTFIDVDEVAAAAIRRFLEREAPGEGDRAPRAAPPREGTVLGVGPSAQLPGAAPSLGGAPRPREKTMVGVAPAAPDPSAVGGRAPLKAKPEEPPLGVDDLPEWPDEPPKQPDEPPPPAGPTTAEDHRPDALEPDRLAPPKDGPSLPESARSESEAARLASVAPLAPGAAREAPRAPRKRRAGRYVVVLVLMTLSAAGYAQRARVRPWIAGRLARWTASAHFAHPVPAGPSPATLGGPPTGLAEGATPTAPTSTSDSTAKVDLDAAIPLPSAAHDAGVAFGAGKAPARRPLPHATRHRPAGAASPASQGEP